MSQCRLGGSGWVARAGPACSFQDEADGVDSCGPVSCCDWSDDLKMCYFINADRYPGDY